MKYIKKNSINKSKYKINYCPGCGSNSRASSRWRHNNNKKTDIVNGNLLSLFL